jgi:hypothetical protein
VAARDAPGFSIRQRAALALAPRAVTWVYGGLCRSCAATETGSAHWETVRSGNQPVLLGFWHEALALAAWRFRDTGFYTLTSRSYDGELAARVVRCFGLRAVRGSSSRGGREALAEMQRLVGAGHCLGFTLDGPRGPRRQAKAGMAWLSARLQLPVLPAAFSAGPCWRLASWDRFIVPRPFGRLVTAFGAPLPPPPNTEAASVEAMRKQVETALGALQAAADRAAADA